MRVGLIIAVLVLLGAGVAYLVWPSAQPEPTVVEVPVPEPAPPPAPLPPPEVTPPTPAPAPVPAVPEFVLPVLNDSDELAAAAAAELSIPPRWFSREDLVRRLAVVVDNAAQGEYPRRQLSYLALSGKFRLIERDGERYLDPVNYGRYDIYLNTLEAMDPEVLAQMVEQFAPLVDQALGELGNSQGFANQLLAGIGQILDAPALRGEIRLVQPKVFFEFADPALEELPPLHKLLLRMGPDNTERLQRYMVRLRAELPR